MKLKRLLTAALSAVMALSVCALPAMAEETGAATTLTKTTTAIDWNKKGKLTIHKYETDTPIANNAPRDNGETSTADASYKPLNGVTFTLYQVENTDWLKKYYQGNSRENVPKVEDYYDATTGIKNGLTATRTVKTGDNGWADGTAIADGLELGLYLVVETDKPDAVKQTAEPFLVSIPMTSAIDKTTWLYDVTVNPKNITKYGAATLKKVGQTGNTTDATVMQGYTFKLYKLISGAWVHITKKPLNGQDNMGENLVAGSTDGTLTTDNSGMVSVDGLTQGVYAFVETGVNSEQGYILDAGTAYVFKLNNEGAMQPAGVTDVAATTNSFDSKVKTLNYDCVKPEATGNNDLQVINYRPDFTKAVKNRKGGDSTTNSADYAIGDKVPFALTITVPENIAKLKTFKVTDAVTATQLVYNNDATVKGVKKGETTETTLAASDYDIYYETDGSGFTIDFRKNNLTAINDYAGKTIVIAYTATLQPGAAVVDGTTDKGNVNAAKLVYSNKTTVSGDEVPEKPYTIHDEATIYTFKAGIHKTDGAGTSLGGVKFDLYKKFDDATDKKADADGVMYNGRKVLFLTDDEATRLGLNDASTSSNKWYLVEKDLTTSSDTATLGKVVANGLPRGAYKFVETETKSGYNLLTKPVDANLTVDYETNWTNDTVYNSDGTLKKHSATTTTYKLNNAGYTYRAIEVINRKGFQLPVTGGFGTLLFSGIGVLLVLAGVSVLFSLKKKNKRA